ncbi:5-oxoprolinase subunit B family protein [Demequina pelophila]|uniref:5-oxoprolinase subunit B family protein n=1 Tax=Demequina pelophila TaxID=1638984 RepID=UPI0007833128|nr:carboxyltransferase domain-containing protein [Demequina pelophila]
MSAHLDPGSLAIHPMGPHSLLVELPDLDAVAAFRAECERRRAAGELRAREIVPAARTVLIEGLGGSGSGNGSGNGNGNGNGSGSGNGSGRGSEAIGGIDVAAVAAAIRTWRVPVTGTVEGVLVEIPVRFDGADLEAVAIHWGVDAGEAVALLVRAEFRVAFSGFAPGFAYMSGLPRPVPRRESPRTAVPAGSVALAGEYAGVYPRTSPGGWQLVGTTNAAMFDHRRDPAALLSPGDRVRFVEVR